MIKVTGSNICRLWVTETQLDHLHPFSALKELRLDYLRVDESDKLAKTDGDLSCLAALPELKALYVRVAMGNGIFSPFVITGLYAATQLRTLHVTGALAIVLPASLTELAFMYELDECGQRVEDPMEEETDCFRRWWATYQGALKQVDLDMQPFHQDPTHLSKMGPGSCLWEVTHLRLAFTMGGSNPFSRWGCWRLKQLQTLHLHFRETEGPICVFAPVWDLSTCTGLQYFTISIDTRRPEGLCLSRVTGVSAERFELEFLRDMGTCSPCFDCTSWALSSVSITSQHLSDVGLPMCVRDSLSAVLGSTLGSVSNPLVQDHSERDGTGSRLWRSSSPSCGDRCCRTVL